MAESIIVKAMEVRDFPEEASSLKAHSSTVLSSELSTSLLKAALQDTITRVEAGLRDSTVEALESELESCKVAVAEAEKISEEHVAEAQSALSAYRTAEEVAKDLENELVCVKKGVDRQLKAFQHQREDLGKATAVFDGALKMLLEGGWDGEDVKVASVQAVEDCLATCPGDKVLFKAAASALALKPAERKSFDTTVVEAVTECLQQRVTTLTANVEADAVQEKCAKAEVLGLWALADVAREDAEKAMHVEAAAVESRKRAAGELAAAKKRLKDNEVSTHEKIARRDSLQHDKTVVEAAIAAMAEAPAPASASA